MTPDKPGLWWARWRDGTMALPVMVGHIDPNSGAPMRVLTIGDDADYAMDRFVWIAPIERPRP